MRRYRPNFYMVATEKEAKQFCNAINEKATNYKRRHYPARYTPIVRNGKTQGYICDYWE